MMKCFNWFNSVCRNQDQYKCNRRVFIFTPIAILFMSRHLTPHFTEDEMRCKGTGQCEMENDFMKILEKIRLEYGKPIWINSGFRHPDYNAKVSKTGRTGPHTYGQACDIKVSGDDANRIVYLALKHGMTGIGVSQKGPHKKRFIHVDNLPNSDNHPRPTQWSY